MSQENSEATATNSKVHHKPRQRDKTKRGKDHFQNRANSNSSKLSKQKNVPPPFSQQPGDDLEFNIQDELVSGNFKARGRKTQISINHLLDFQLPERAKEAAPVVASARRNNKKVEDYIHLQGESFINANFKFLVDDRFTYEEQSLDANISIPREKIVRIEVVKGQSCPICLTEDIVAPRMVSCGHLFCYTCMLSFFASDQEPANGDTGILPRKKRYKECPLCSSIIRKEKSVPVLFVEPNESLEVPQVGLWGSFQLMCKPHGSMLPLPVSLNLNPVSLDHFPSAELTELAPFSRIMKCNLQYAIELFRKELNDIKMQHELDRAIYNDDGKFSKLAIEEISQQISSSELAVSQSEATSYAFSHLSLEAGLEKFNDKNAFFFYQTAFEANTRYFLSPLDVKVLLTAFGQYSEFPPVLGAHIEDIHYGAVVTESLIQKYKYFGHLPIGSDVTFVDLDWRSVEILPPQVYQKFASELNSRRRKSTWKKQREDKEKRRHEKRLEQQQEEFYMRENGNSPDPIVAPSLMPSSLQHKVQRASEEGSELQPRMHNNPQSGRPSSSRLKKTIWGTSIPTSENPAQKNQEDTDFEKMLENLNQQQNTKASGKKKKRMVTLLTSNPSRGSL
ncbi:LANO_0G12750g1_1 [Lachancea nothofagi CBS 11611]|uniref:LANO_0G12750g1_1 n=1 Tax=Lachancea nothofagi CBS 11611 TaxID=1266666 RepID=A0A1G4KKA7_9SACH|nr:LANO_0G12750g1_1 [Lachancea nothofagi CBS 11611]